MPAFSGPLLITVTFTVFSRLSQAFATPLCETFIACTPRSDEDFSPLVFSEGLSSPGLSEGLSSPGLSEGLSSPGLSEGLSSPGLSEGLSSPGLSEDDVVYSAVRIPRAFL